jgi:hypothetical protein
LKAQDWTAPFGSDQVFIENQGQFDQEAFRSGLRADFAIDHGFAWKVLLGSTKVAYVTRKMEWKRPSEEAGDVEAETRKGTEQSTLIRLEWLGANPAAVMQPMMKRSAYYTYSYLKGSEYVNVDHADGYDELIVRDLYPQIDLHWTAPAEGGVKYALHLRPGADPTKIYMGYMGATPVMDSDGNLRMSTVLGELIDHAPTAWYADNTSEMIPVRFRLTGCTVKFELGSYDNSREVVIDPWTVNPAFPLFNRAFEVDTDGSGNVFAWGGGMGYNLKKYNSAGTLQWTHVSPWDTSNAWFGELLVLSAGDVFISAGSAAKLRRLTAAGATTFTNNGPFINLDEYWTMIQNCDFTKLLIGGTRIVGLTNPRSHLFDVSMATGNQLAGSPYRIQIGCSAGFPSACEIRKFNLGADGYIYAVSNDTIYKLNSTFGQVYRVAHSKNLSYYSPSYMANSVQGINGLAAGTSNFYVNWGSELRRYDNATGALLTTVAITGGGYTSGLLGSGPTNSGMIVDGCGNVYVGSAANVYKYSSTLVSTGSTAVTSTVYDLHLAPSGDIIVGGNGYVSSVSALAACVPPVIVCPVLPATLEGLEAVCQSDAALVKWTTAQEQGCRNFAVERWDGTAWQEIGTVAAKGGDQPTQYSFRDAEPNPSHLEEVLYRLQIMDQDGSGQTTGVVALPSCDNANPSLVVSPSVTSGPVEVRFAPPVEGEHRLEVRDLRGALVHEWQGEVEDAIEVKTLNLQGQAPGVYLVKISGPNGWEISTKVVKQ